MSKNPDPKYGRLLDAATQERMRIMQEAASAAAAESKARGLPEIHWRDGRVVYVLPDGSETTEMPESLQLTEAERGQV